MLLLLLIISVYVYTFRGNPRQPTNGCFMLFLKLAGVSIDFSRANNLDESPILT